MSEAGVEAVPRRRIRADRTRLNSRRVNPQVLRVLVNEVDRDRIDTSTVRPLDPVVVGTEAAIAFCDFVEKYELVVTAEDVLDNWDDAKAKIEALQASGVNALVEKIKNHCTDNKWTATNAKNLAAFADTLGGEMLVSLWNAISGTQNLPNIQKVHKLISDMVIQAVQASREV